MKGYEKAEPTTLGVMTELVNKINRRTMTWEMTKQNITDHRKMVEKIFNMKILTYEETLAYPDLRIATQKEGRENRYVFAARIERNGEIDYLIFSPGAVAKEAKIFRKNAISYIEEIMMGKHRKQFTKVKNRVTLPEHVRAFMNATGLDADSIETLLTLTGRLEFHHKGTKYKLSTTLKRSETAGYKDNTILSALSTSPDPEKWQVAQIQLSLRGTPKVRIIKKGVSIGQAIPEALRISLAGKPVADVIILPGLENMIIKAGSTSGSHITHLVL